VRSLKIYNCIINNVVNKIIDNIINKMRENKKRDDTVSKVDSALKSSNNLTITEIVKKTKLTRSSVRTALAKLDGANNVSVRKVGMAKVYSLKRGKNK